MEDSCTPAKRLCVAGGSPVARVSESRMHIIEVLVHRALRRVIANEALAQIAFAAAAAAGGLALILLLGTRFLEWWTIAPITAVCLAIGAFQASRRIPGAYVLAQRIDRAAGLDDLLSTAIHFHDHPPVDPRLYQEQLRQAEAAARSVDLESTVPFRFPRAVYPLAAFSLLASGLVALRYALSSSLDLHAPITEVFFQDQLARKELKKPQPPPSAKSLKALKAAESLMAKLNSPASPDQQDPDALDKAIDQALAPPPAENSSRGEKGANAAKSGQPDSRNSAEQTENGDSLNGNQNGDSAAGQDAKSPQAQQGGSPSDKSKSGNGSEGDNSSLLSKLKDAVSNMFSKNRQDGGQGQKSGSQQNSQMAKAGRQAGEKNSGGKGREQGDAQAESQEGDPNGDPQQGQQAQGKNAAKTSAQNSAQAGSGIGSRDGAKDLRAAEQLKAMGRISEIIGKRAATISGETMVEVQSGNQQLRTAYSERSAAHGEADSDVSRDQIPSALQSYVANYFEQVRKPASGPPARKAPDVQSNRQAGKL